MIKRFLLGLFIVFLFPGFAFSGGKVCGVSNPAKVGGLISAKVAGVSVTPGTGGVAVIADDMQTDNTGDWNKADCTLAFDAGNKHYEITRTAGTQTIYQQDSVAFVDGVYYKAVFDLKDGTAASVTVSLLAGDTFHGAEVLDESAASTSSWVTHTFYFTASATTDSVCFSSDFLSGNYELKNFSIAPD